MAIVVSTDLAAFTNGATDSLCNATTNWATAPTTDTESMIEGSACNSLKVNNTTIVSVYTFGASVDLTGKNLYCWMLCTTPTKLATKANGGMRLRVEDGSANYGEWYVDGSDTYPGGWQCYCVPTNTAYNNKSASAPTLSAITKAGVVWYTVAAVNKISCFWDAMRYGTYLRIDGGDSTTPATFADLYTGDNTYKYGIVTKFGPIYLLQGQVQIGSTTAGTATYFKDVTGALILYKKNPAYVAPGSAPMDNAATPAVLASINEILCQGNGTANTEVYFGDKASGNGYGGPVISSEADYCPFKLTASDTNITKFSFAGTVFQDAGIITGQAYNANKDFTSCTFLRCREVKASNGIVTKCVFASAPGPALLLTSTTHYYTNNIFVNCYAALRITTTTGSYTITGSAFISNTYDVLNATAGAVTVNFTNCSPAGSTSITVLTSNNKALQYNATGTAYTDESTPAFNDSPYDMNLLDGANETNDAYYFGNTAAQFTEIDVYVAIPGSGTWTLTWEYWNGAWTALSGVSDGTSNMRPATKGTKKVTFTAPGDWVTTSVNSITAYWIRARISSYTSVTYPPKGTETWLRTTDNTTLQSTVDITVTCLDQSTQNPIQGVAVTVKANGTGPYPYNASVTITRSGSTATVAHTGHGLSTGNKVEIAGADQNEYNRIKTITKIDNNSYSFQVSGTPDTPATGTITSTAVFIDADTNSSGQVTDSRSFSSGQAVAGFAAKGTSSPLYKRVPLTGTVSSSAGLPITSLLVRDD